MFTRLTHGPEHPELVDAAREGYEIMNFPARAPEALDGWFVAAAARLVYRPEVEWLYKRDHPEEADVDVITLGTPTTTEPTPLTSPAGRTRTHCRRPRGSR